MVRELWSEYGWVVLVIVLIIFNILLFIPTGNRIHGFYRGVSFNRKETYGDIIGALILFGWSGYIIWVLVRIVINKFR